MYELQVCSKTGQLLRSFALGDDQEVIVGRDATCDIQINVKSVSREHCAIDSDSGDMYVRDLGSTGGTYVDGKKIERIRIEDGIQVSVGPAVLKFIDAGL